MDRLFEVRCAAIASGLNKVTFELSVEVIMSDAMRFLRLPERRLCIVPVLINWVAGQATTAEEEKARNCEITILSFFKNTIRYKTKLVLYIDVPGGPDGC